MKPLIVSRRARSEIERVDRWWIENRPAAPDLFFNELRDAFDFIRRTPNGGLRYRNRQGVRRVLLRGSRYHVYYEIEPTRIAILSVWSAVRGRGPKI